MEGFDPSAGAGYDTGPNNQIVRTNDTFTYNVSLTTRGVESGIVVKAVLPQVGGKTVATWPAVLNLPDSLCGGQPVKLSVSKPLWRPGLGSHCPGDIRADMELVEDTREAPLEDGYYIRWMYVCR